MPKVTDISDIIGWIVGGLAALVFVNYKNENKQTNDRLKVLDERQLIHSDRLTSSEAKLDHLTTHFLSTLEEIKSKCSDTAKDIETIKITLAQNSVRPHRHGDMEQ